MTLARPAPLPDAEAGWAYFLDVDGTLIELAESPDAVRVDDALLGLVARLHRACGGAVALVSGRSIADLDELVGSVAIPLAGQHGLERRDAFGRLHTHATASPMKQRLRLHLEHLLQTHAGLRLEDKGLTLALHYRQAPQLAGWLHRHLRLLIAECGGGLGLQKGKRVLEIKPLGYDKGSAIGEFMTELPFRGRRPVFIGDDLTDEHGFAMINRLDGLSIRVGPGRSLATHRLPDVGAVHCWLARAATPRGLVKGNP